MATALKQDGHPRHDAFYYENAEGIHVPKIPVTHRDDQYDATHFDLLLDMQQRHFWYRGRHRFLLHSVKHHLKESAARSAGISAVDLGGGCGGWIKYLADHGQRFDEVALADSSQRALQLSAPVVGGAVKRFQVDLRTLHWHDRWDIAFLLDVLEHVPEDIEVMREIAASLRPGGLLFVTTPALQCFWTYNDDLVHHVRRYSRGDFAELAQQTGLELCRSRYFMTLLSPLLLLSRLKRPDLENMTAEEISEHQWNTHRVPLTPMNELLAMIFAAETPIGHWLPMPWGTSVLGVFRKPEANG